MKIKFVLFFLLLAVSNGFSQSFFYVQFADKGSPCAYSLDKPQDFLSQRAIERRKTQNIAIDSTDFPIHNGYLQTIKNLGLTLHSTSRWLNGATFFAPDTAKMAEVRALPFVVFIQKTHEIGNIQKMRKIKFETQRYDYGLAENQAKMLKIDSLHNLGFRGETKQIAVIDNGFNSVDVNPAFEHFRTNGQLLGTATFTIDKKNVYEEETHGTNVLSTIVGYLENQFVGAAPNASCWLIQSEINESETLMEVDNWVAAAEFADSVGVDIISSSLGYTVFDDAATNFSYQDMNGRTARNSIAATMAAEKGILVIIAAGNDGNKPWHYISTPADADKIFAVGAVDSQRQKATFSSFGPTADGRTKPDVAALGELAALVSTDGIPFCGNGTSFSAPILAGAAACLWQALPTLTCEQIRQLICSHASQSNTPDNELGYGIPDIFAAYQSVTTENKSRKLREKIALQTLVSDHIALKLPENGVWNIKIVDLCGRIVWQAKNLQNSVEIDCSNWEKGVFCIAIGNQKETFVEKIVKN